LQEEIVKKFYIANLAPTYKRHAAGEYQPCHTLALLCLDRLVKKRIYGVQTRKNPKEKRRGVSTYPPPQVS
jgi:hypothetical protein